MEIGSVLELDSWDQYCLHDEVKNFSLPFMGNRQFRTNLYQSGRNAIEALLVFLKEKKGIHRIIMPDYMCSTVSDAALRAGVEILRYKIDRQYEYSMDEIESIMTADACIYIAHYFGKPISDNTIQKLKELMNQGKIVIEDVTLSLLSEPSESRMGFGKYLIGSLRKWFPIADGGMLSTETSELPKMPKRTNVSNYVYYYTLVQKMKREYVLGGEKDKKLKENYLNYYNLSIKELFSDYDIYPISPMSLHYLCSCDARKIKERRMLNYDLLYHELEAFEKIELKVKREEGYLPFGMVINVDDRDALLNYLIKNDVYCNVHWRINDPDASDEVKFLSDHSITIPCDQRYGALEMHHIQSVLERYFINDSL